jgi:hypothetical protein
MSGMNSSHLARKNGVTATAVQDASVSKEETKKPLPDLPEGA